MPTTPNSPLSPFSHAAGQGPRRGKGITDQRLRLKPLMGVTLTEDAAISNP